MSILPLLTKSIDRVEIKIDLDTIDHTKSGATDNKSPNKEECDTRSSTATDKSIGRYEINK